MAPMSALHASAPNRRLFIALAISLLAHGLILSIAPDTPPPSSAPARLEARLAPRLVAPPTDIRPESRPSPAPSRPQAEVRRKPKTETQPARARILTARKTATPTLHTNAPTPTWTIAQKAEMDNFLNELATEAKAKPKPQAKPDLLESARSMARDFARSEARAAPHDPAARVERIPGSPPIDPFSLDFYLDAVIKKLNRSAAFVKNDPRTRGIRSAAVEVRLNPNGTLKSFTIVNSGDQQEEIAFVKQVVERALPFAAFPPDIADSARSLGLMICIQPATLGGGNFGFSRRSGTGC